MVLHAGEHVYMFDASAAPCAHPANSTTDHNSALGLGDQSAHSAASSTVVPTAHSHEPSLAQQTPGPHHAIRAELGDQPTSGTSEPLAASMIPPAGAAYHQVSVWPGSSVDSMYHPSMPVPAKLGLSRWKLHWAALRARAPSEGQTSEATDADQTRQTHSINQTTNAAHVRSTSQSAAVGRTQQAPAADTHAADATFRQAGADEARRDPDNPHQTSASGTHMESGGQTCCVATGPAGNAATGEQASSSISQQTNSTVARHATHLSQQQPYPSSSNSSTPVLASSSTGACVTQSASCQLEPSCIHHHCPSSAAGPSVVAADDASGSANEAGSSSRLAVSSQDLLFSHSGTPTQTPGSDRVLMRFQGHCNMRTIKDVAFLGSCSQYVASGSDDGRLFVWHAGSGKLLLLRKCDSKVVNCMASHPHELVLATGGERRGTGSRCCVVTLVPVEQQLTFESDPGVYCNVTENGLTAAACSFAM